jgi:hypothetical protein
VFARGAAAQISRKSSVALCRSHSLPVLASVWRIPAYRQILKRLLTAFHRLGLLDDFISRVFLDSTQDKGHNVVTKG